MARPEFINEFAKELIDELDPLEDHEYPCGDSNCEDCISQAEYNHENRTPNPGWRETMDSYRRLK